MERAGGGILPGRPGRPSARVGRDRLDWLTCLRAETVATAKNRQLCRLEPFDDSAIGSDTSLHYLAHTGVFELWCSPLVLSGAPDPCVPDRCPPGRSVRLSPFCVITPAHRSKIDLARHGTWLFGGVPVRRNVEVLVAWWWAAKLAPLVIAEVEFFVSPHREGLEPHWMRAWMRASAAVPLERLTAA